MNERIGFEDGVLLCIDIIDASESLEAAQSKMVRLLESYRIVDHDARAEMIKDQLGLWGIL